MKYIILLFVCASCAPLYPVPVFSFSNRVCSNDKLECLARYNGKKDMRALAIECQAIELKCDVMATAKGFGG